MPHYSGNGRVFVSTALCRMSTGLVVAVVTAVTAIATAGSSNFIPNPSPLMALKNYQWLAQVLHIFVNIRGSNLQTPSRTPAFTNESLNIHLQRT